MGKSGLHGLSVFGDLKYPPGFKTFGYVAVDAPKGGRMNFAPPNWGYNQSTQTFNTLNSFVRTGDAPPRMEMTFDTLMARATDEPDAVYGLLAESADVSDDGNTFTFHLRPEARFHDGTPLTAEDVAFSLMLLKEKGHPSIIQSIEAMVSAAATDAATATVTLSGKQNRFTILTIVGLPIFSKAFYGAHPFDSSSLDVPLGSGPYRVGELSAGHYIEYQRVADYWGKDLPVNVGQFNFDTIRIDFYRQRQTAFEAFTKGDTTYREEFTSLNWAEGYNFPALMEGKVKKSDDVPDELRPDLYGLFFNTRRATFRDPRTRLGLALAFDFEWSNKNLFYGSYERSSSFFETSEFAAVGMPTSEELALLEPLRAQLPPEVFGEAYVPPRTDGSGHDRAVLKRISDLFAAAGWKSMGSQLVDEKGAPFAVEFMINSQSIERVLSPYVQTLANLGVAATLRQVDPVQYGARVNEFGFDAILSRFRLSATPLEEPPQFFGSKAADTPGSYNFAGVKDPAIDALLDRMAGINSRDELVALVRAIDRILRASHYWMPAWHQPGHHLAYWDIFGWPEVKPDYAFTPETTWWFDTDRAAAIGYAG